MSSGHSFLCVGTFPTVSYLSSSSYEKKINIWWRLVAAHTEIKKRKVTSLPHTHKKKGKKKTGGLMMDVIQSDSSLLSHPLLYIYTVALFFCLLDCLVDWRIHTRPRIEEQELVAVSCLSTTRTTSFIVWLTACAECTEREWGRGQEVTALLHDTLNYHSSSGTHKITWRNKRKKEKKKKSKSISHFFHFVNIFWLCTDTVSCFVTFLLHFFLFFVLFLRAI